MITALLLVIFASLTGSDINTQVHYSATIAPYAFGYYHPSIAAVLPKPLKQLKKLIWYPTFVGIPKRQQERDFLIWCTQKCEHLKWKPPENLLKAKSFESLIIPPPVGQMIRLYFFA